MTEAGTRGRFAPSPSGRMHLGNLTSALLAWLSARSKNGSFLLRIEDLDPRCCDPANADLILDDLRWLGLDWDEDPFVQSADSARYDSALEALRKKREVYPCFCSRADLHAASAPHASDGSYVYAGTCRGLTETEVAFRSKERDPALRIAVPKEQVSFVDLHEGLYEQDLACDCGDFVLRRSDGVYAYQLVCVVDDAAMGVTEVVRGHDLVSSTPRQIFLQRSLGLPTPSYAHHPLLVDVEGRRLSKRDRDCDCGFIRDHVRCSQDVVGFLASKLGLISLFEPLTPEELIGEFSWVAVTAEDIPVYDGDFSRLIGR